MSQPNDRSKIFSTDPEIASHPDFVNITDAMFNEHMNNFGDHTKRGHFPCIDVVEPKQASDWKFKHQILRPCSEFPGAAHYHIFFYRYAVKILHNESQHLPANISAAKLSYEYKNFSVVIKKNAPGQFYAYSIEGKNLAQPMGPFGSINELVNRLSEITLQQIENNDANAEVATVSVHKLKQRKCTLNQFVSTEITRIQAQRQQQLSGCANLQSNIYSQLNKALGIEQTLAEARQLNKEIGSRGYTKDFPVDQQLDHQRSLLSRTTTMIGKLNTFLQMHIELCGPTSPSQLYEGVLVLLAAFKQCEEEFQLQVATLESMQPKVEQKSGGEMDAKRAFEIVRFYEQNLGTIVAFMEEIQKPGFLTKWTKWKEANACLSMVGILPDPETLPQQLSAGKKSRNGGQ